LGSGRQNVRNFSILDAESCGNNVIVDADLGAAGDRKLWVNRNTLGSVSGRTITARSRIVSTIFTGT